MYLPEVVPCDRLGDDEAPEHTDDVHEELHSDCQHSGDDTPRCSQSQSGKLRCRSSHSDSRTHHDTESE